MKSPEEGSSIGDLSDLGQLPELNTVRANLDKFDSSTEPERGTNERPRLVYWAHDKVLTAVDEFGHATETIGSGETALRYLDAQIKVEETKSQGYIERLQEIRAKIIRES